MTLEQAIKRIQDKESQIEQLRCEVRDTKAKLIELTPFKKGDKVRVTKKGWSNIPDTVTECMISGAEYCFYGKDKIEYKFNKIKKDGTMSEQSAGIYRYDKIEKI